MKKSIILSVIIVYFVFIIIFSLFSSVSSQSIYLEDYNKALYLIDKREYEKALPYLEIAIKTDISSLKAQAYFQIGFCYGELKSYTKAIEAYKQAIRINPDDADTHFFLGDAYYELGFYEDAIESFKQAIRINPDDADAHYNLGIAYLLIGDRNSALNEYKILKELDIDLANKLFDFIY